MKIPEGRRQDDGRREMEGRRLEDGGKLEGSPVPGMLPPSPAITTVVMPSQVLKSFSISAIQRGFPTAEL